MSQDAIIEKSKAVAHSKETIESPCVNEKLLFAYPWVVWEQYEVKGGGDWSNSLAEVARFSDVEGFWRVWNTIPHSDPSNFFSFPEVGDSGVKRSYANYYQVAHQDSYLKVGTLCFFKEGIKPEWEDPVNTKGGNFTYKPKSDLTKALKFWENFVFALVTNNIPHMDEVCGIRVVEKNQFHKFEIWTTYGFSDKYEHFKEHQRFFNDLLCETLGDDSLEFAFSKHV